MPRVTALKINSVWSAHGHTFLTGDAEEWDGNVIGYQSSCLSCGGEWILRATPEAFSDGAYQASNGDECTKCPGVINADHGELREPDAPLCNCLLCS